MAPCVLVNSITGVAHRLADVYFPSVQDLKQLASNSFHIPVDDILLLLPYGIILKKGDSDFQRLQQKGFDTIFVFDRGLFNAETPFQPKERFQLYKPMPSPMDDETPASLLTKNVVLRNLAWLKALNSDMEFYQTVVTETRSDIQQLTDSGAVMLEYLKNYCHEVELLYNRNVDLLNRLHADGASNGWKLFYDTVLKFVKVEQRSLASFFSYNELKQLEDSIHDLDRDMSRKLKDLKKSIDSCYLERNELVEELDSVKRVKIDSADDMDKQMVNKFLEMSSELEKVSNECTELQFQSSSLEKLSEVRSTIIPRLQTISSSFFNKARTLLDVKISIQNQLQKLFASVATSQMSIVGVKSVLNKDLRRDIKLLQSYELRLSRVLDFPLCYGLYLIELYRQQSWIREYTQVKEQHEKSLQNILQAEMIQRNSWYNDFNWITQFVDVNHLRPPSVEIPSIGSEKEIGTSFINDYISQLDDLNVNSSTVSLLKSKLSQADLQALQLPESSIVQSSETQSLVDGYKIRIKKLENLLLDARLHQYDSWPAGVLNKEATTLQMFRHSTINDKLNPSYQYDTENSINPLESRKTIEELKSLQSDISRYSDLTKSLQKELAALKHQFANIEVERNAYKESMTNLNQELSNLLIEREGVQNELGLRSESYKKHISSLLEQNNDLVTQLEDTSHRYEEINRMKEDLLANMATQECQAEQERTLLQEEVELLKKELSQLRINNESTAEVDGVAELNNRLEKTLYDVFQGSIYILESIGLLLSKDKDGTFQIVRVKGLRKDLDASLQDMNGSVVKSVISQDIKTTFESIKDRVDYEPHKSFLSYSEKLFGDQLFEASVIRRFNDIESLAKKLRKENKSKKLQLQKCTREKITIQNLQIGDLALFLPITDQDHLLGSSVSSLNSSFSSIDLNSSTQSAFPRVTISKPDNTASNYNGSTLSIHDVNSSAKMERSTTTNNGGYNNRLEISSQVAHHPTKSQIIWAAFTATSTDVKYILRSSPSNIDFLKDKEWVMGRITGLEKHIISDNGKNPFKFAKNTVWYEVDALFNLH